MQLDPPSVRQHQSIAQVDPVRPADSRGDWIQEALDRFTAVAGETLEVPATAVKR